MKFLKSNKYIIIILVIFFGILVYTHFNTFVANDDIPYSLYFRNSYRINNIFGVLKNQIFDYSHISSRIIIHSIVQSLLIFDKNVWSFLNPLMIVLYIVFGYKIVNMETSNSKNKIISILSFICLFLLLFNYRRIIYWVAGSVNYVWPCTLLFILLYLYYKYGFCKYKIVNTCIIAFLCMLCECTMVFTICFIIGNFFIEWYRNKKINKDYFWYFIGLLGSLVILLSPSTFLRMSSDSSWDKLSLIGKLNLSIPIVSKNLLNYKRILNVLPYIFTLSIIYNLYLEKIKRFYIYVGLILINYILIIVFNVEWLYFIMVILLMISEYIIYLNNKSLKNCILSLSFYAVVFFNIFTPLYYAGRPNYFFYCYMIIYIVCTINRLKINNVIIYIILGLSSILLLINEIKVYCYIGSIYKDRIQSIEQCRKKACKKLYLKKIDNKYDNYHMDINLPNKEFFTYGPFISYYRLPKNIDIIYK